MPVRLVAAVDDDQRRLDRILRKALPDLPLSALHRMLRKGRITVDGQKAAPELRIKKGQIIEISGSSLSQKTRIIPSSLVFDRKLEIMEIIYEGNGLLILNKPAGISVHGSDSLEEHVRAYLEPKANASLSFRPGPLHRLDKPTSGLIAFSTNLEGARLFSQQLRERKIRKLYLALIDGIMEKDEKWEDDLVRDKNLKKTFAAADRQIPAEKPEKAITMVKVIKTAENHTLILAEIITGLTHQIRAQAAVHGHPLTGDRKYGGRSAGSYLLHAWKLELTGSVLTQNTPDKFVAPLPDRFSSKIRKIFGCDLAVIG